MDIPVQPLDSGGVVCSGLASQIFPPIFFSTHLRLGKLMDIKLKSSGTKKNENKRLEKGFTILKGDKLWEKEGFNAFYI